MDERVDRATTDPGSEPLSRPGAPVRRSRGVARALWLLLLVVIAAGGWYWWSHRAPHPAPTDARQASSRAGIRPGQLPPQPVGAAVIGRGDIRIILNALGTVTSLDTVTVVTQINGQMLDVGFKEGQIVHKGDFLAQIDPRPYQVALEQAQGTLARDQALLGQAQSDLKRYQMLGRQDSIAQQQLEDQRFLVAQYTGTVQTDQAAVDNAKLNLSYCRIVSPVDGQVGLRLVDPGNYVQTSSATGIAVIAQMQPMSVLFAVPQDNLPEIMDRVRAGATLSVEAYNSSNTRLLATGQLSALDNQIDTTTGTVKLRALFPNGDEHLYPNQFVNARLLVNTLADVVRVPVPAVQRGELGTFVYVINPNSTVSVRPIVLGPTDGGFIAVTSGLQAGERVVTDGTDRLRDGAAVTVPVPNAAAAQPHGASVPDRTKVDQPGTPAAVQRQPRPAQTP
jgi:multidrug efflux system membrane fusion protein